jgi:DNA polymerase (family 10)
MLTNAQFAGLLEEIGQLLQVAGANTFKVRAFQNAARAIEKFPDSIALRVQAGTVTDIDGIGKSIASDLAQMLERGSCDALDQLRAELPAGIMKLLEIQGLGPKKVQKLYQTLGIGDIDTLEAMAKDGQLAALDGFGKKTEEKILAEIQRLRAFAGRTPFAKAMPLAVRLLDFLRETEGVQKAEIAGSLRRRRETVGDLDFVVASERPAPIMDAFASHPLVEEIIAKGETKTSVYLQGGLAADLRVVPPEVFGATLHHFTGSKEHNVEMRSRAIKRGLRVSEWGVFKRDGDTETPIACHSEEDIFRAVDLPWIPPELREGDGEIDAAEAGTLVTPVALADIRSDLHMHTTWSDGAVSVEAMSAAGAERGREFICITDHSRSLTIANGLSRERLLAQIDEIDAFNATNPACRVLKGLEVDILEHGELDMDDDVLERLDWVVGSIHSRMNQPIDVVTRRLTAAVRSGLISAIGHPTGRLIGHRDGYEFDLAAIIEACEAMGVALEINASPERLDLNDRMVRQVLRDSKVWLTVNTDAHSPDGMDNMVWGVGMARRGGAAAERVINTLPLSEFEAARRKPARAEK